MISARSGTQFSGRRAQCPAVKAAQESRRAAKPIRAFPAVWRRGGFGIKFSGIQFRYPMRGRKPAAGVHPAGDRLRMRGAPGERQRVFRACAQRAKGARPSCSMSFSQRISRSHSPRRRKVSSGLHHPFSQRMETHSVVSLKKRAVAA